MSEEFENEEFEAEESVSTHELNEPIKEGEEKVGVILASERLDVRYYENMTIADALNQVKGKPESDKFRVLLNGSVASLDTIIPDNKTEVIFVGNWILGNQKKIFLN